MITLKENQNNTIAYQKETDTPLVSSSYVDGYVYNVVLIPTLQNDTGSASIAFTSSSTEDNPRWETLEFELSSSNDYNLRRLGVKPGTTYDMEIYYGPKFISSSVAWGNTSATFGSVTASWEEMGGLGEDPSVGQIREDGTLKYTDRVFVTGSVSPIEKKYISSNENAVYTVYQG
jgi:hypothetical protein